MNRSYRKIFKGGVAAAIVGSAMLMFVVCGDDDSGSGSGGGSGGGECGGGIGKYCYFPANNYNNNTSSCNEIGTTCATGAAVSEATCTADNGYVIDNCSNPPNIQYCDYGTPVYFGTDTSGGCHSIPSTETAANCIADQGTVVSSCPNYGPPAQGVQCDFGFNNIVVKTRADCLAEAPYAGIVGEGTATFYCDFGQPTMYGSGGCYARFAPFSGTYPPNDNGDGAPCDPWSKNVTMAQCVASNTNNGCIGADPTRPDLLDPTWGTHKCCTEEFATLAAFAAECSSLPGAVVQ